jgi:hypothetical protein
LTVATFNNRNLTQATVRPENWSAANSEAFALILILVWPNLMAASAISASAARTTTGARRAGTRNAHCSARRIFKRSPFSCTARQNTLAVRISRLFRQSFARDRHRAIFFGLG